MSVRRRPSIRFALLVIALGMSLLPSTGRAQTTTLPPLQPFPGGFLESATTGVARPLLSATLLGTLLPARGEFTFPPPYNTRGVRITNATDCGGADCVDAVGYSYWHNINNHVGSDEMLILLGLNRARGGAGPSLFSYNKVTGQVTNRGPLFDSGTGRSWHSTEGWYFSATQPTKIYIDDGPRMLRYDVLSKQPQTVFDVSAQFGADKIIWQMHSSDDDRVHSATLRQLPSYEMLGCVVYQESAQRFLYYPKIGDFNECAIDKSGRWLMSLENVDGLYDLEMRIFDLQTGTERLVWDQDGAVGHGDMGYGYVVGSDQWDSRANAVKLWDFSKDPLSGSLVSYNLDWSAPAPNHIAHGNARPDRLPSQQYACGSGASTAIAPWANEIICFRLDGSYQVLVVAPVMTNLSAPGGGSDPYVKEPKGNLDVTGQYFIWTSNAGGSRLDAFIVKVPATLLSGGQGDTTPPAVSITSPASGSTLSGPVGVTAAASDDVGVAGVRFLLDGGALGSEVVSAPYIVTLSTAGLSSGAHALTAVARDAAGNSTVSAAIGITVANDTTAPIITSVAASGVTTTGATLGWTSNEPADTQADYGTTTAYGTLTPLDATPVTAHSRSVTGLTPGTLYHYRVGSRDAAGNLAVASDFTFTTASDAPAPASPGGHKRPIGYWRFSEGSGAVTADASGSGYTGSLINGPAWVAGIADRALSFDGADDYVGVAHAAPLDAYPLTVAGWIKTSATGLAGVVNKYLPGSLNGYQIFMNGGNLCAWYFRDGANYVWDGTSCTLATPGANDGRWHHVAFVVDAAGGRLYLDGALKSSRAWTGAPGPSTTTTNLSFGRYPGIASPCWPGALDEVRLYDRALAASDLSNLYRREFGVVAVWPFSEGSGLVTADASGSGYTGSLINGPTWVAGMSDRALSFDGVNDYVGVAHAAPLDAYPLTVTGWIKTSASGLAGVVNKYLPGSLNGYQIFMNGGKVCAWYFRDGANYVWDGTSCTLATPGANDGVWHHVAFVVDAAGGRLFLDGTLRAIRAWTGAPGPSTTTTGLSLGRYPGIASPYWPGALDELRLYGRSLSAGEIATEAGGI